MNVNANESGWTTITKKSKKEKTNIDAKKMPTAIKATQNPIINETTMTIEPAMIGFVAGRNGCNLKRIKETYGVRTILPPKGGSQVILEGPAKMISAVKKDIEENLSCKLIFSIENHQIFVVGRGGENIIALENELNVKITIMNSGEILVIGKRCEEAKKAIKESLSTVTNFVIEKEYRRLVLGHRGETISALVKAYGVDVNTCDDGKVEVIGNNKNQCEAAKKAIESMIERWKSSYTYEEKFSVPGNLISYITGKDGWNVNGIESTYSVHLFLRCDNDPTEITVKGSSTDMVSTAKKIIEASVSCKTSFFIEKVYRSLVLGQKGEKMRALSEELNVHINIQEDGGVVITGTQREATEAAKKAIESLIEQLKTVELYEEKFSVPASVIGYIAGKNGSNMKRIESNFNVHLFLPLENDEPEITVKGSDPKSVTDAKTYILESVGTSLEMNKSSVGKVIGLGGEIIRRLNKEYGVAVKFEEEKEGKTTRTAYILGAKENTRAARKAIKSIIYH